MIKLSFSRRVLAAGTAAIVLALAGCSGSYDPPSETVISPPPDLAIVRDAIDRVQASYVQPVDTKKLLKDALKGMLGGLDAHSDYMDDKEFKDLLAQTRGRFAGIGAELSRDDNKIKVISPIDDTPAARAGVRAGDIISRINGQATEELSLTEVVDKLRGAVDTNVTLTLDRAGEKSFDVTLTRAVIHVVSVKSQLRPGRIGYARITTFNENTQQELLKALDGIQRDAGRPLKGFVLDLRNDPGGVLEAAIEVAGNFLDGGVVVSTRGRDEDDNQIFQSNGRDLLKGVPMVVLINGASASASEIVAGALQDRRRATIVGTQSFGKGSVQSILPLDGGNGALRLTTALYYTPAGRSIQGEGITPDEVVASPPSDRAGRRLLHEADLRNAFKNPNAKKDEAVPTEGNKAETDVPIDSVSIGTEKDVQLTVAVKRLEEMARAQQSQTPEKRG